MAVKIRLARRGRKKLALYDVVVADARAPRDGKFIEKIGTYNPNTDPATINIDADKAFDWVMKGAQPTDSVRAMLSYRGVLLKKHLQIGVQKGAVTQEEADKRFEAWIQDKESKIQTKVEGISKAKADKDKARLEAETKIKEARAAELQKKVEEAQAEVEAQDSEANAEVQEEEKEEVAVAAEATTEEAATAPAEAESTEEKETK
ncbi:MAG: 30S ribosomal protein S16 [Bacteroidota bacterium]